MDVFEIREATVSQYANYVRDSLKILDERLKNWLYDQLNEGIFWPQPLLPTQPKLRIWLLPSGFGG
jgi:hypothetical protein